MLRAVRREAGVPAFAKMARWGAYSPDLLAQAATGTALPAWKVAEMFLRACGVDGDQLLVWRRVWQKSATAARVPALTYPLPPDERPSRLRPAAWILRLCAAALGPEHGPRYHTEWANELHEFMAEGMRWHGRARYAAAVVLGVPELVTRCRLLARRAAE